MRRTSGGSGFLLRTGQGCGLGPGPRSSWQSCGGTGPAGSRRCGEGSSGLCRATAVGGDSLAQCARASRTMVSTTTTAPEASCSACICVEDTQACREDCGLSQSLFSRQLSRKDSAQVWWVTALPSTGCRDVRPETLGAQRRSQELPILSGRKASLASSSSSLNTLLK